MKEKSVIALGDLHCGHVWGLVPPRWYSRDPQVASAQQEKWLWYCNKTEQIGRPDVAIINADCIDGRGEKSGGTELITSDRGEQCDIAVECIKKIGARHIVMTYGTPYHAGHNEDWEDQIAKRVKAEQIAAEIFIDINGCIFNAKHQIGGSSVPHGQFTAPARDAVWNLIKAFAGEEPKADVLIRSHTHTYGDCGNDLYRIFVLPALQTRSKYGMRRISKRVTFGLVHFTVSGKGRYSWQPHFLRVKAERLEALRL